MKVMINLRVIGVLLSAMLAFLLLPSARAVDEINGELLLNPSTGGHAIDWWGEIGMTYFIQHSDNLEDWSYIPDLVPGADAQISYQFLSNDSRGFYKLLGSSYPTTNPSSADFDGDGVSNLDELNAEFDPLSAVDADSNGVPDDWETFFGISSSDFVASLADPVISVAPGLQPEAVRHTLKAVSDTAGNVDLKVITQPGYRYKIERSVDLGATSAPDAWTEIWDAYGLGQEISLRVFDAPPPPPGAPNPPPPISSYSFFLMEMTNSDDILVRWTEGADEFSTIIDGTLPESSLPIWQQRIDAAPLANPAGDYELTIYAFWSTYDPNTMPPVNEPPLGANDPTLRKLTEALGQLDPTQTFTGGGGSAVSTGVHNYYRVQISTPDSDGDDLFDWQEFLPLFGSNPFMTDSDGDGVGDYEELLNGSDPGDSSDGGESGSGSNIVDTDGDGFPNTNDFHPLVEKIDFPAVPIANYFAIEITAGDIDPIALNNQGHALLQAGDKKSAYVWSNGSMKSLKHPDSAGLTYQGYVWAGSNYELRTSNAHNNGVRSLFDVVGINDDGVVIGNMVFVTEDSGGISNNNNGGSSAGIISTHLSHAIYWKPDIDGYYDTSGAEVGFIAKPHRNHWFQESHAIAVSSGTASQIIGWSCHWIGSPSAGAEEPHNLNDYRYAVPRRWDTSNLLTTGANGTDIQRYFSGIGPSLDFMATKHKLGLGTYGDLFLLRGIDDDGTIVGALLGGNYRHAAIWLETGTAVPLQGASEYYHPDYETGLSAYGLPNDIAKTPDDDFIVTASDKLWLQGVGASVPENWEIFTNPPYSNGARRINRRGQSLVAQGNIAQNGRLFQLEQIILNSAWPGLTCVDISDTGAVLLSQVTSSTKKIGLALPGNLTIDAYRDGKLDSSDEAIISVDDQSPVEEEEAYGSTGELNSEPIGALVICHYDEDEENEKNFGALSQPSTDIIYQANNGVLSNEDFEIGAGEEETINGQTEIRDVHQLAIEHMPALPADAAVFLVVGQHSQIEAFHLYKRIATGETAIWGGYHDAATPAPWTTSNHPETNTANNQREVTWLLNPNATGQNQYVEHRSDTNGDGVVDAKDPHVFGIEGVLYKGMKHRRDAANSLVEFDGIVDLHLEIEVGGQRTRIDSVKWTQIRVPAFPGAEGAGKWALGGRYGDVYKVTNLNDSGAGSLREGIQGPRPTNSNGKMLPRTIVFDVDGYINLQSTLNIPADKGFLTIAGQTSPGDGICLRNYGLSSNANHVVIRNIRARPGDALIGGAMLKDEDAFTIWAGNHIIVDHCSFTWGTDTALDIAVRDDIISDRRITVQWCIIGQTLRWSFHPEDSQHLQPGHPSGIPQNLQLEDHSMGSAIIGFNRAAYSFHHNIYANCQHNTSRMPKLRNNRPPSVANPGWVFDFRNNIVYNWKDQPNGSDSFAGNLEAKQGDGSTNYNLVKNYYKVSVGHPTNDLYIFSNRQQLASPYLEGNELWRYPGGSLAKAPGFQDDLHLEKGSGSAPSATENEVLDKLSNEESAANAYQSAAAEAGFSRARNPVSGGLRNQRDTADTEIVTGLVNGRDDTIDSQEVAPTSDPYNVPAHPVDRWTINRNWNVGFARVGYIGYPTLTAAAPLPDADSDGLADDWETQIYQADNIANLKPADPDAQHTGRTVLDDYLDSSSK